MGDGWASLAPEVPGPLRFARRPPAASKLARLLGAVGCGGAPQSAQRVAPRVAASLESRLPHASRGQPAARSVAAWSCVTENHDRSIGNCV